MSGAVSKKKSGMTVGWLVMTEKKENIIIDLNIKSYKIIKNILFLRVKN
jgi:hypothetical protein